MSSTGPIQDLAPGLDRCFLFDAVEDSYAITGITGSVPEWLRGSYYVNGPARFERAGRRYKHWLDGDGCVCALHFTNAGIRFSSRFVGTGRCLIGDFDIQFLLRQSTAPDQRFGSPDFGIGQTERGNGFL